MIYSYSIKVRRDGVRRIGRERVPFEKMKERLQENKRIVRRRLATACWEWTGSKTERGYGSVGYDGKFVRVSRLAWMLYRGPIPEGIEVCHRCDNPSCFNPAHLFLGTHADNIQDAFNKGLIKRHKGESHPMSKLTADQVKQIRKRFVPRTNSRHLLAKEFGVSDDTIWLIVARRIWKHI